MVGGDRDRVEPRRAVALDRVAAGGDGQAGEQRGEAPEVGGAVGTVAERDVLDEFGLDAGLVDRAADGVSRHRHRRRDVEAATAGLRESGAGIGDEYCFAHGKSCLIGRRRTIRSQPTTLVIHSPALPTRATRKPTPSRPRHVCVTSHHVCVRFPVREPTQTPTQTGRVTFVAGLRWGGPPEVSRKRGFAEGVAVTPTSRLWQDSGEAVHPNCDANGTRFAPSRLWQDSGGVAHPKCHANGGSSVSSVVVSVAVVSMKSVGSSSARNARN